MICCKITFSPSQSRESIALLFSKLSQMGNCLAVGDSLYFADVEDPKINSDLIKKIVHKFKIKEFLFLSYDQKQLPNDGEFIDGWVWDKIIKINYNQYEQESQELFHKISNGLTQLNVDLDEILESTTETTGDTDHSK